MSLSATNIFSIIDDNCGTTSTSFTLATKARYLNLGIDNLLLTLFGQGAGGAWQLDDSNQTDYPIIIIDLISGQRDYAFISDGSGNLILDIYKVQVKDAQGVFHDLTPVDQQGSDAPSTMTDGQNSTGTPTHYDKTGNGIFLDLIPSYASTGGLRVFINRESTYFTASDTTKKWGYTGIWHEYLVLYASYQYARAKTLANRETLKRDLLEMEEKIKNHAGQRERNVAKRLKVRIEDNR